MKTIALALLLLLLGCHCLSPSAPTRQALSIAQVEDADGDGYCTAFYLGADRWATANHCTWMADPVSVGGRPIRSWASANEHDLAVLHVPDSGWLPALPLGETPDFGDPVYFIGFPMWQGSSHFGKFAGSWGTAKGNLTPTPVGPLMVNGFELLDVMVDGGASGSPVFDEAGNVVGVVDASHRGRPYAFAVPVSALRELLAEMLAPAP